MAMPGMSNRGHNKADRDPGTTGGRRLEAYLAGLRAR